jgi:hypothetical protein
LQVKPILIGLSRGTASPRRGLGSIREARGVAADRKCEKKA